MKLKTKIARKQSTLKIKALRLLEESKRLALAVVILQFLLASGFYWLSNNDFKLFESKTIIIKQVEAKAIQAVEIVKKEETIPEIITRVADNKGFAEVELLKRIAFCESSYNPKATNKLSSARGLFQILDMHGLSEDERYNPEIATAWTINKIRKDGTKAWNSSKACWN